KASVNGRPADGSSPGSRGYDTAGGSRETTRALIASIAGQPGKRMVRQARSRSRRQLTRAVRAAARLEVDLHLAERALFHGRFLVRRGRLDEDLRESPGDEADDHEVEQRRREVTDQK